MKKITLLAVAFLMAMVSQAQVIYEQPNDGDSGIVSDAFTDTAIYSADDFTLDASQDIYYVRVYGFQQGGDLQSLVSGFTLYIYTDNGGVPSGDPSTPGDGILELDNVQVGSGLTVAQVDNGEGNAPGFDFTIDLVAANGGPLNLDAGTYWVVAAPNLNFANGDADRWNWLASSVTSGAVPQLIDVDDVFGAGATDWMEINGLTGGGFDAMAFSLYDAELGLVANQANSFTHYLNNDQLVMTSDSQIGDVAIFNLLGQQVVSQKINSNSGNIDLNSLSAGIYLTKVSINGQTKSFKFVKK